MAIILREQGHQKEAVLDSQEGLRRPYARALRLGDLRSAHAVARWPSILACPRWIATLANRSRTRRAPPRNHPPTQRRVGKPRPVRSRLVTLVAKIISRRLSGTDRTSRSCGESRQFDFRVSRSRGLRSNSNARPLSCPRLAAFSLPARPPLWARGYRYHPATLAAALWH